MTRYSTEIDGNTEQLHASEARREPTSDWVWAVAFAALVMGWALAAPAMQSWIAVPLFACGVLTSLDAVAWVRRRIDLYDPIGVIGVLGVHFFFIAPILHIVWNVWSGYITPLQDWPAWIGWMAVINAAGLLLYRFFRNLPMTREVRFRQIRVPTNGMGVLLILSLTLTAGAQVVVYWKFGGLSGYIDAFEHMRAGFLGWGWVFMVSESFPILFMITFAVYCMRRGTQPSWLTVMFVLALFFGLKLVFGGLRGSRSNTVWGVFWAAGIIHLLVRRIPRLVVIVGLGLMLAFMYIYGFYKAAGVQGLEAALDPATRAHLARNSGRTFNTVLLGDLARADIQAYLLHQTCSPQSHYQWACGRTYLGTVALLVPRSLWPGRPDYKVEYGTNALFGEGFSGKASNVYGIAGEAMLNFGPVAALASFAVLGYLVGRFRKFAMGLPALDIRWAMVPFGVYLCVAVLVGDSDNVLFAMIKEGTLPFLVVYAGSQFVGRGVSNEAGSYDAYETHWEHAQG